MHHFDDLDLQLLSELKKDSSISVPILSKKLGTNSSVIYSRIKRLINKIRSEIAYRKRLKELKKKDPFIYK